MLKRDPKQGLLAATLFLARGLPAGMRATLLFTFARRVASHEFAALATALILVETLRVALDCGQDTISVKLLSRPGGVWRRSIHVFLRIKACSWLLGVCLNSLLLLAFLGLAHGSAFAVALIGVSQIFWNLPINLLQARGWLGQWTALVWLESLALLCCAPLIGALLDQPAAIAVYAALEYFGLACFALMARTSFVRHSGTVGRFAAGSSLRLVPIYLRRGWSVCMGQLAALAHSKFDVLLITNFASTSAAANYLFAQRLFDLSLVVTGGASSVMYAAQARRAARDLAAEWRMGARYWLEGFAVLALAVSVLFWLLGPLAIRRWFPGMPGAIAILELFGVISVLAVGNQYLTALLNSLGRFALVSRISMLILGLILTVGSIMFWAYGVTGLMLSIAAVYATCVIIQGVVLRRIFQRRPGVFRA